MVVFFSTVRPHQRLRVPGELRRMKPGFRPGYVAKMKDGVLFGEKMLFSLAESLGIFVTIDFVYSQRTQLADMALLEAA